MMIGQACMPAKAFASMLLRPQCWPSRSNLPQARPLPLLDSPWKHPLSSKPNSNNMLLLVTDQEAECGNGVNTAP